ncbi:MAG: NADP-dependent malic enzyme [Planctomycetes bacterium]|nr:NADP-dependent malic enzyme [Planctomycetota bacterium]
MLSREELLARATRPTELALPWHAHCRGKIEVAAKCPIRDLSDFAVWYTPGVAAPCRAIQAQPDLVYEYTNKANCIAIVSDGSRILGLGDIGPEAGLPVMEGKALLFKYLGAVDAVPLCLKTKDPEELIRTIKCLEPSFGAINLEDISQPKCFHILDRLRAEMGIPVWHDDQQGTATIVIAGLVNALQVVGKNPSAIQIAMVGCGAANVATYRLLKTLGVDATRVIVCDRAGTLHRNRLDISARRDVLVDKWKICVETNASVITGGIREALRDADVCIAFSASGPDIIRPEWIRGMKQGAIVFACANPIPEIWPWEAAEAGARVVATGRSDFPNQVNNSLAFPAIFRGTLDVRARSITDEMALAAAFELAKAAEERGISAEQLLPTMDDWEIVPRVATAVAMKAQQQGVAQLRRSAEQIHDQARSMIERSRRGTELLMREHIIPDLPRVAGDNYSDAGSVGNRGDICDHC